MPRRRGAQQAKQFLPASDILNKLNLLAPEDAKNIYRFLQSRPDIKRCEEQRDRLLKADTDLSISFVCWQLAFTVACPGYLQPGLQEWDQFEKKVQSLRKSTDEHIRCILTIGEIWGEPIVCHYGWRSKGYLYRNLLRSVAKKIGNWSEVIELLNHSISRRIRSEDRRTPKVKNNANHSTTP
ncbi:hypothetical protein F4778DRAFT_729079 [Xylariomycetidae sp. FL2044]|nr:hypothetical protein F4778DRAFT_767305 [Xylariomycetidae sp. FL2044]KAH9905213.1 hypothetical protein F4778DRAFT_729079 [Xylariomycetidae sp. FL2044]